MKKRALLAVAALATAVAVPVTALAATGAGPGPGPNAQVTCTGDQQRLMLRDGTGANHPAAGATAQPGQQYGHMSGPHDGTGQQFHGPAWTR